ncbi:carbohydrate porin [Rhodoblastus sp.]|mgnify:CR=1 FL=1|jgi:porin|uniref:carbohydrate porin n=1 Tax=Rhodoblastus sp. TaxID=1962975 RepID=UPI0025F8E50C|nr:carbohydrate porin [Rhodoblastus sp.]
MGALQDFSALNRSRAGLAEEGVYFQIIYTADSMANLAGGIRPGVDYSGRLDSIFDIYFGRMFGKDAAQGLLADDRAHIDILTIQGAGITGNYVGSLASISGIEASPTVRLFEAWWEHVFGPWSLRFGQMGIDSEFFGSVVAGQFSDNTFSWPVVMSADLPDGGAASTLSTPAVRLKYVDPGQTFEWQAAAFNGDPTQPGPGQAQRRNPHGLDFRLRDGAFLVTDLKINAPFLPGASLKLGGWGHTGRFNDFRYNATGGRLAVDGGAPKVHCGDYGFYGVVDAPVPGVNNLFFLRALVALGRVNLVSEQIDAGWCARAYSRTRRLTRSGSLFPTRASRMRRAASTTTRLPPGRAWFAAISRPCSMPIMPSRSSPAAPSSPMSNMSYIRAAAPIQAACAGSPTHLS